MFGAERSGAVSLCWLLFGSRSGSRSQRGERHGAERCLKRSGVERRGAEWSDVWSGAKFFLVFFLISRVSSRGVSCVCLLLVAAGHVANVSRSLFLSLLAIVESGGKGWISCCRETTESYIIEL